MYEHELHSTMIRTVILKAEGAAAAAVVNTCSHEKCIFSFVVKRLNGIFKNVHHNVYDIEPFVCVL